MFGFGKGKSRPNRDDSDDDEYDDDEEEKNLVNFQGAVNGKPVDMNANARLAQAALEPTKELITDAIERRAEMIRMDFKGERAQTTLAVDGMPYAGTRMPKQQASLIVQMVKLLAGLDAKLRGKSQNGGIRGEFEGTKYDISVDVVPQPDGTERLTIRLRNLKNKLDTPADLGFSESTRQLIRDLTSKRHGLLVVCGPSGSGTTTTTYALLRGVDVYMYSIYSIVNQGTRELFNVKQFEVNEGDDIQATCMRMIREEADVIFAPPFKEAESVKQFMSVADRICVVSEMSAKDSAHAIDQLA
ncbi:MAG: secretion system protein E, partial [Planctomycetes bacterium]|nr:secretion system protein E [Planctomycetota bacterium]